MELDAVGAVVTRPGAQGASLVAVAVNRDVKGEAVVSTETLSTYLC